MEQQYNLDKQLQQLKQKKENLSTEYKAKVAVQIKEFIERVQKPDICVEDKLDLFTTTRKKIYSLKRTYKTNSAKIGQQFIHLLEKMDNE